MYTRQPKPNSNIFRSKSCGDKFYPLNFLRFRSKVEFGGIGNLNSAGQEMPCCWSGFAQV